MRAALTLLFLLPAMVAGGSSSQDVDAAHAPDGGGGSASPPASRPPAEGDPREAGARAAARPAVPIASLLDLRELAAHGIGQRVAVVVQLRSRHERWNPYVTRFGPAEWIRYTAWADEQLPWREEDWEAHVPRLFVRRGSAAAAVLGRGLPHARFRLEVTVRQMLLGEPWIEVHRARPLARSIGEGTLLHAESALERMGEGRWQLAINELHRAMSAPLPDHARAELERLLGQCERELER
jgi:hypothetical protein